ncbi:DNA polymerase III subunit alpha [Actinomyces vulturis]|uniref:DNA polymerase III subunit alpha n=1 Tax=Actinomyces vulturis TaxID=1857645 RepID=UPI0008352FD8|nr:DNA polymerase III subunit alpha [Actinomyces vulturis]
MSFTPLHIHTDASLLDGIGHAEHYAARAKELGLSAMSITDHGSLGGVPDMIAACKKHGLKPILGIEAYLAIGSRFEHNAKEASGIGDEGEKIKRYEHITLLASNKQGWRNLVRMHNESWRTVWGGKPRFDYELMEQYSEGIICLTGCLAGPILGPMVRGNTTEAQSNLDRLIGIYGADNVFVEIMEHGIEQESAVLPAVAELADKNGVKTVATCDCHYVEENQALAHEAWLAKQRKTTLSNPNRWTFNGCGYHLMSEQQMRQLRSEPFWQEAVSNTYLVEQKIDADVMPDFAMRIPHPPIPEQYSNELDWVVDWVRRGAIERYGDPLPAKVREKLNLELSVFRRLDMVGYGLLVGEMIDWAKRQKILVGPGRGSAAGSVMLYCMGITDVDPIESDTLFERFLDPERAGMPDVDTDFERGRREEVYRHEVEILGEEYVARLGTVGYSKTKASLKNAATQLMISPSWVNTLTSKIPGVGDTIPDIETLMTQDVGQQFRTFLATAPQKIDVEQFITLAKSFEGTASNVSIHACGVIVSNESLIDLVPMRIDEQTSDWVTCWDGGACEAMGLVKLDLLGLRTLDQIRVACDMVGIDPQDIPRGKDVPVDDSVWDLLMAADTTSVFQLSSGGIKELCARLAPRNENDITALGALYRPGPMGAGQHTDYADRRNDRSPVVYSNWTQDEKEIAALETVLSDTYGLIVYQEQVMRLGGIVGGFTASKTNALRKAMSKKKKDVIDELGKEFVVGAPKDVDDSGNPKTVFSTETAKRLWGSIESCGSYLFNKCLGADTLINLGIHGQRPIGQLYDALYGDTDHGEEMCRACGKRQTRVKICSHCRRLRRELPTMMIPAYDKRSGKIEYQHIVCIHDNGFAPVIRVSLANGTSVTCTANHRWMDDSETFVWACNLIPGESRVLFYGGFGIENILVSNVEHVGMERVFDVEMEAGSAHTFFANNMVSHNSHAVAYGRTTFTTAWLKAHYPAAFGAATLAVTDKTSGEDRRSGALAWIADHGITISAPNVNTAALTTQTISDHEIVIGLGEVKSVGNAAAAIIAARPEDGYTSISDLVSRTKNAGQTLNSAALEALAKSGALDDFGPRAGLVLAIRSLAKGYDVVIPQVEYQPQLKDIVQRQVLGMSTDNTLTTQGHQYVENSDVVFLSDIDAYGNGDFVSVYGQIDSTSDKRGETWRLRTIDLVDGENRLEVACWNEVCDSAADLLEGQLVVATGMLKLRDTGDEVKMLSLSARSVIAVDMPVGITRPELDEGVMEALTHLTGWAG